MHRLGTGIHATVPVLINDISSNLPRSVRKVGLCMENGKEIFLEEKNEEKWQYVCREQFFMEVHYSYRAVGETALKYH